MQTAYAHDLAAALYEPLPEGLFQYKFDWDPTLIFFLIMFLLYIKGLRAFRGRSSVSLLQKISFFLGIGVSVIALSPPIDPLSDRLFFVHMIQHMLIMSLGVPFILFGVPFYVIPRGLTPWVRRNLYWPVIKNRYLRKINGFFLTPLLALFMSEGNFWFWHVPRFYNLALLNDWIHLVEHGSMAFTSFYLWRNLIDPYPLRSPLHMGYRLLLLLAMMAFNTVLSAALTFSKVTWYAYDGIPMPQWWAHRWDHLDDQRLGGLIMWVPGGAVIFLYMTVFFFVWVHREEIKDKRLMKRKNLLNMPSQVCQKN